MIELIVLNYLAKKLEVPVFMERQSTTYTSYVVLEKTSGTKENHINSVTFAIQSYAPSLYEAALLNEEVKTAMEEIIELPSISKSKLNSDYNFTNPTKKEYRYQAVFNLVF